MGVKLGSHFERKTMKSMDFWVVTPCHFLPIIRPLLSFFFTRKIEILFSSETSIDCYQKYTTSKAKNHFSHTEDIWRNPHKNIWVKTKELTEDEKIT